MKMVVAIVKHFKEEDIRNALLDLGIQGMSVSEVKGFGRQKGHVELYRGSKYEVKFLPKVRLEFAVDDNMVESVIKAVCDAARTGEVGDGKIFVMDIVEAVRIRTGETGVTAIT